MKVGGAEKKTSLYIFPALPLVEVCFPDHPGVLLSLSRLRIGIESVSLITSVFISLLYIRFCTALSYLLLFSFILLCFPFVDVHF